MSEFFSCVASVGTTRDVRRGIARHVLDAGVDAYLDFDPERDSSDLIVAAVYKAMKKAARTKPLTKKQREATLMAMRKEAVRLRKEYVRG